MKKLHLVGFTPGNDGLILSPRKGAKSGGFVVSLDDDLVASIEEARRVRDGGEPAEAAESVVAGDGPAPPPPVAEPRVARPRSALSPREIQARLRAGSSIAEVAAQAGVDDEWVLRFADPILAEQNQVVESARRLTFVKSRRGPSAEPLGESVQWNLTDRGVRFSDDVFSNCWSAFNLHGARWAVRFTYTSRQRRQVAEWEVDLRERSLSARNRLASDLGHVEPGRRRPRLEPAEQGQIEAAPPPASAVPRQAKRAVAAKGAPVAKAAGRGAPVARAGASAGARKAASAQKSAAKKSAAKRSVAPKASAKKSGREPAPRKARSAKRPAADKPRGPAPSPARPLPVEPAPAAPAPPEPLPDRPSHLARPPSPMNMANRATSFPGRRPTGVYPRPVPAPAPAGPGPRRGPAAPSRAPASAAAPSPHPPDEAAPSPPPAERRSAERVVVPEDAHDSQAGAPSPPAPATPPPAKQPEAVASRPDAVAAQPAAQPAVPSPAARPRPVAPPLRRPPPVITVGGDEDQRPAVVILPNPPPASKPKRPPGPAANSG